MFRSLRAAGLVFITLILAGCGDFERFLNDSTASIPQPGSGGKVAVLLPLSGDLASLGAEMRNAVTLAMADQPSELEVQFFDTQSTAAGAQSAGAQARSFGAGLVLGPLIGANIEPARSGLGNGPSMVSFSNDVTKASPGNYIFGVTPANGTKRILQYASTQGKRNIGILYPDDNFGRASFAAATEIAPSLGINIVAAISYSPAAGREGASSRQTAAQEMGRRRSEIDGLFIPDGGGRLREIASLAFFYRLDPGSEQYLGTQRMDDPSLTTEPALNGANFSAIQGTRAQFESRFAAQYGSTPRSTSITAYDAMLMAASLNGNYSTGSLTNGGGFTGVLGTYRLNSNGTTERQMAIKEIGPSGIRVVEAAGSSFLF